MGHPPDEIGQPEGGCIGRPAGEEEEEEEEEED